MRYLSKASIFTLILVYMLSPGIARADGYITDAVAALQTTSVYVATDTEGTDSNTVTRLQNILRENDNIVLVMLPSVAESGTNITTLVQDLSERLGNGKIIGLAVGDSVIGYAPMLPLGVAGDQMRRAISVSNEPVTTLVTFTQNIHLWLSNNPQPTPSPSPVPTTPVLPKELAQDDQNPLVVIIFITIILVSVYLGVTVLRRSSKKDFGGPVTSEMAKDLIAASNALSSIKDTMQGIYRPEVTQVLQEIYDIAYGEIVEEIRADPHRATGTIAYNIKKDLEEYAKVLHSYSEILSGTLSLGDIDTDLQENIEKFFPKVKVAFRKIADQLDENDIRELENLVRLLSNQFKSRGLTKSK